MKIAITGVSGFRNRGVEALIRPLVEQCVKRDRVYEAVAQRRYAVFGKATACEMPTKEMQSRVLA